ncbi:MAG TPA: response regulator transcription factor, partial [Kofleriaceae bacterium]|nr:response regulator transcription factor [Kofleriaceae bacterium]
SMHSNDAYVAEALRNGAAGYVLKQAEGRQLVQAIRAVAGGARYLSPPLSAEAIDRYNAERSREDTLDPFDTLSTREREVLPLAAEGLTSAEIGKKLAIGRRTVETYRANLLRKLNLKSQAELVRYAVKRGLLPDE